MDYIREHQQAQIDKQIEIAQIPASPFHEEVRGKAMEKEFRRVGLQDVEIDPVGNVLGWRKGKSPRTFVIAAHLDTVFPPGTDFTVKRNGERLNGPGLADDSRGLAVLLALAEALDAAEIVTQRSLLFVADVGEEGAGNLRGGKYLLQEGKHRDVVDAFISIDGADNRIVSRETGSRRYRVSVTGPGGHSYANFGRANPAHAVGRMIAHLVDIEVPIAPKTTYSVGRIGGGTSVNSIPCESWLEFDMRSEEEGALIRLEEEFLKRVQSGVDEENRAHLSSGTSVQLDAKRFSIRHAVSNPVNRGLVQCAVWAAAALGLDAPEIEAGATDSNTPLIMGIPAITMPGGGKGNLHSLEEWFEPEDAYQGIQMALLTVLAYDEAFPADSPAETISQ